MKEFNLKINKTQFTVNADESMPLLWVIRNECKLYGTKYACGIAQCGACTVHLNGQPVRSCVLPMSSLEKDSEITTIEGLGKEQSYHLQKAWVEEQVPQCGYCQSGQIMQAASLFGKEGVTREEIKSHMSGNLCRCGTYMRITKAIEKALANKDNQ